MPRIDARRDTPSPVRSPRSRRLAAGAVLAAAGVVGTVVATPVGATPVGATPVGASPVGAAAPGGRAPGRAAVAAGSVPSTPLLSVRRAPAWIESTVAAERLASTLPPLLAALGPAAATSCLVVGQGRRTIFAVHPGAELLPASNMKVLTATAELERLGAASRIETRVTASVAPAAGVVAGDLYLVGGGDPLLWTPGYQPTREPALVTPTSLAALAAEVRAAGIRRVTGSIVGDESRFDAVRTAPGWKAVYSAEGDAGPVSALDVDNGFAGAVTPPTPAGPSQPAVTAAALFTGLLRSDGVTVSGAPVAGVSPAGAAAVASTSSVPLGQVVGAVLRVSDDTGAEQLLKLLGARVQGSGTTAAGVTAVRRILAADRLPVAQLRESDGSGLSLLDRATCGLVAADLRHVGASGPVYAGLPVAGRTGTLVGRMVGTAAAGRLHAKTGTLDDVAALSGFVQPTAASVDATGLRAPLVFSLIVNGVPYGEGEAVADRIGVALAAYPDVPPLADALPRHAGA